MTNITTTTPDNGRAFRTTVQRNITFAQALDIYDPFIMPAYKGLANGPRWDRGESYGPEWRNYFYPRG